MSYSNYLTLIDEITENIQKGENLDISYNKLGVIYAELNDFEKAEKYFLESINNNSSYFEPYINLGIIYGKRKKYKDAVSFLLTALSIKPNNYNICYNLAYAYQELGVIDKAIYYYGLSVKYKPDYANSYFNRSLLYLLTGKYEEGWNDYYEWGYKSGDLTKRALEGIEWNGENLRNKTILIYCDQGYGDTINFIRYAQFIKMNGAYIFVEVPKCLQKLFLNFNSIDKLIIKEETSLPKTDYYSSIFKLAKFFYANTDKQINFPYLYPTKREVNKWKQFLGDNKKLKIGFVWKGNPIPEINNKRHIELHYFYKLFAIKNTEWYSLHPEKNIEITIAKEKFSNVLDLTKNITNFNSTAALICNLDFVVSIDSAVAHLSGALNKTVLLMLNFMPDWRWGLWGNTTNMYPSAKIFRQKEIGNWEMVINEIYDYIISLNNN
ncbi:MAG TPA: tetratricopeptide repeat protein [Melioribacteraceae bacterium]|nr:tetratricopeptide repeat protein [Melioribacteraceae bacterium]